MMTSSYTSQSPPASYMHHHHHHIRRHRMPSGGEESEDEELDPRIQIELEKLNKASEEINRLELELDDSRAAFRTALSESTQRLNGLAKKLGTCVDKARPYYDARMKLKEAHLESQKAALRFERACSMHEAAKEMVQLAEEGYKRREQDLDPTWQEMLNHATMKVNDAERERIESEEFHQRTTYQFKLKEEEVQKLQKDLKRSITKSKPYFEMKAKFNQVMEERKRAVSRLEEDVASSKALYSQALRSLEAISDDIHRQRLERRQKLELGVRGTGVGAESPSPPPWEKGSTIEGSASFQYTRDSDNGKILVDVEKSFSAPHFHRPTGIVCHEAAFRKKTSLTESLIEVGKCKPDPLDVVVFKISPANSKMASAHSPKSGLVSKMSESPPAEMNVKDNRARSDSHGAAIELSAKPCVNVTAQDSVEREFPMSGSFNLVTAEHRRMKDDLARTSCSSSPPICDLERSQSSVRRAQEWVNKSPIPQQRSFVKSKSLIDATSGSLGIDQQQSINLSSSLTIEAFRGATTKFTADALSPVAQYASPSSESVPPEVACHPGSPSSHRRSPKLQGLILCVDPAGLVSSSVSSTITQNSSSQKPQPPATDYGMRPMITTQQLGFLASDKIMQLPVTTTPKPPSSLIAQHLNKMMSTSRTCRAVPSTLSASYSIPQPPITQPSPTCWNPPAVSLTSAVSLRHQLTSPTPSSPSAERVSLSGRSDTMSASSSRGAFLKPPSDSSDTESIASTGPMLDDDQVELISMDFTEQSILAEAADDTLCYGEDRMPIPRGHWSRMSLPPRLSYLEGFLERARIYSLNPDQKPDETGSQGEEVLSETSTKSSPSYTENVDINKDNNDVTVLFYPSERADNNCLDLDPNSEEKYDSGLPEAVMVENGSSHPDSTPQTLWNDASTCDTTTPDSSVLRQMAPAADDACEGKAFKAVDSSSDWDKSEYFV